MAGPAGDEIHTDEYGRVRVQFHWDRKGQRDEKSSAWIRVATPWAGSNFGMMSIPRIGAEVVVQFLDGNPDRPLITGMVPNAHTLPPWPLPANKTQTGILSRSTPGGGYGNANAIRFDDNKGMEQLWLHAEKDQLTEVEHDEDKWVGNDRRKTVDRDETSHIKRNRDEQVGNNETVAIGGNRVKSIGRNRKDDIDRNWSTWVARMKTETIGMAYMQNVGMGRMENVGLAYNLNVGTVMATVVGVNQITKVGKTLSITAGDELSITVGLARLKMMANGKIFINGTQISIDATGPVQITGKDVEVN